jgi:single-stranded DNA-specific DHH superfamily exonuclease
MTMAFLIIALDCGIKSLDRYAKERNIDFIICDHQTWKNLPEKP